MRVKTGALSTVVIGQRSVSGQGNQEHGAIFRAQTLGDLVAVKSRQSNIYDCRIRLSLTDSIKTR